MKHPLMPKNYCCPTNCAGNKGGTNYPIRKNWKYCPKCGELLLIELANGDKKTIEFMEIWETALKAKCLQEAKEAEKAARKEERKKRRYRCGVCGTMFESAQGRTSHTLRIHKIKSEDYYKEWKKYNPEPVIIK